MQWFCTTNRTTTTNSAPASSISLVVHVNITWVRDRTRSPCPSQLCCLLYARLRLRPRSLEHVKGECGRIVEGRHELATDMKCLMHMRARWRRLASDLGKLPASQLRLLLLFHQKKDRYYLPAIDQRISEIEEYLVVQSFLQPSQKSAERELAQDKSTYPKRS